VRSILLEPYIYVLIFVSIGIAALAEILVYREKRQMKEQFMDELERQDSSQGPQQDKESKTGRQL
jgi:hypothetical protein